MEHILIRHARQLLAYEEWRGSEKAGLHNALKEVTSAWGVRFYITNGKPVIEERK